MDRKLLKDLGVSDEAIDKIMAENGKDIEKLKGERDDYKQKYEDTQKALKGFDGVNINELKGKVEKLTADLAAKDKEYETKLDERDFQTALKAAAAKYRARNVDATIAVIGTDKIGALKGSKNREKDIEAAFKALSDDKDTAYLFEAVRAPQAVSFTPGAVKTNDDLKSKANEGLRAFFGKGDNSQ